MLFRPDATVTISGMYAAEMNVERAVHWIRINEALQDLLTCQYSHAPENNAIRMTSNLIHQPGFPPGRMIMDIALPEELL